MAGVELRRLAIIPHLLSLGPLDLSPSDIFSEPEPIEILRKVLRGREVQQLWVLRPTRCFKQDQDAIAILGFILLIVLISPIPAIHLPDPPRA